MGSFCITSNSFWSSFKNQALLGNNNSFSAGVNYENRFGISELGTRTAGMIIPVSQTSLGIVYSHFGYPDFKREMGGISCGMALSDMISAGVQVDYFSEKTSGEYDVKNTLTYEAGLLIIMSEKVRMGVHIFNPVPNSLRRSFLPSSLSAGAGIELSKVLYAGVETEISSGERLILRTGFEYEAFKKFWLRGGFSSENTSFTFGIGYIFKSIKLDLGFATHEKLGVTSSVSLIFKIH
ncbi:MAG: hypothetical protein QG576_277 [Bacteroidota bacterium]|nr:hypothetical protein [Bacteroidota bacterium]